MAGVGEEAWGGGVGEGGKEKERGGGRGLEKGEGGKGRNACYKNQAIRITPTDFLIIELCQRSIRSPIRNWRALLRMADFTAAAIVRKNEPTASVAIVEGVNGVN